MYEITFYFVCFTCNWTDLELIISTMPTAFSNTSPSFLQLSAERDTRIAQNHEGGNRKSPAKRTAITDPDPDSDADRCFPPRLTDDDGVDLALHLDGGVVAGEDVHHLLQLRVLDHQVVPLLKVLLRREGGRREDKSQTERRLSTDRGLDVGLWY